MRVFRRSALAVLGIAGALGAAWLLSLRAEAAERSIPVAHGIRAAVPPPPAVPEAPDPPDPPDPPDSSEVFVLGDGSFLGVRIGDVTQEKVSDLKMSEPYGALVSEVAQDSPGEKAGLKEGDVIVSYQGQRVESARALIRMVRETPSGRTVRIDYLRDGSKQSTSAVLEERSHGRRGWLGRGFSVPGLDMKEFKMPEGSFRWFGGGPRLGVMIQSLSPQLGDYFGVKEGKGVLITEVIEDTPASKGGLKAGDVILSVDGKEIEDEGDLREALADNEGKSVTLRVMRNRSERSVDVTLEKGEPMKMRHGTRNVDLRREIGRALAEASRASAEAMTERAEEMSTLRGLQAAALRAQKQALEESKRALKDAQGRSRDVLRDLQRQMIRSRLNSGGLVQI